MTYRNDPYDPKQPSLLSDDALKEAVQHSRALFSAATTLKALTELKPEHLGDRSAVSLARREIGSLQPAAKAEAGKRVNEARSEIQAAYDARLAELEAEEQQRVLREEQVDVTLPWDRRPRGARHPLTTLMERVGDLFVGMGYEVAEGPEVELEWANFDALNIAPDHPARGLMDTFWVASAESATGSGLVLRTHTSPVQARTMLTRQPPIYIVVPGRVYRTDELDATHSPVFHQVEGLVVDRGITMAHLKGTLDHFARAMFGPQAKTRWRPHYFPFTSRRPSSMSGSRRTATARSGSSGAAAAWSTRTCCAPAASIPSSTRASPSGWASSAR
jgi:phenylalanyl-tRNA synthetase alpha chain